VYPIFKNGQSSLLTTTKQRNWNIFLNEKIKKINSIDVFVRDPVERLASGISSFIQTTVRDHPDLDVDTVNWFAENYLYLNRHYAPQFLWLVNLARYTHIECVLNFLDMSDIKTVTDVHEQPFKKLPVNTHIPNNEMYQRIDQVLIDSIGSSLTFTQLVNQIRHKDKHAYEWVIGRSQRILKPTYVLPQT
jgi:hypothetical protein